MVLKVLYTVLNWGLGHAARSIPVIRGLVAAGHRVELGSDGLAAKLLKRELPELSLHHLPGYDVRYQSTKMVRNIAMQLPKIGRVVRAEHRWVRHYVAKYPVNIILSDHRYGCHHPNVKSIFLSHQIRPRTPFGHIFGNLHERYLHRRFDEYWIPDSSDRVLSGILSKVEDARKPVSFLGPLSRITIPRRTSRFRATAVLSGPEPQRTYFEAIIHRQMSRLSGCEFCIVRGTDGSFPLTSPPNVTVYDFLPVQRLAECMARSGLIIARSGYSTIMDIVSQNQPPPAVLVPTPGQTEQLYLARRVQNLGRIQIQTQKDFDIEGALRWQERTGGQQPVRMLPTNGLERAIQQLQPKFS